MVKGHVCVRAFDEKKEGCGRKERERDRGRWSCLENQIQFTGHESFIMSFGTKKKYTEMEERACVCVKVHVRNFMCYK